MAILQEFWQQNQHWVVGIGVALLVFAAFWALGMLVTRLVIPQMEKRMHAERHKAFFILFRGFKTPLTVLLRVGGLCLGLLVLSYWMATAGFSARATQFWAALPKYLVQAIRLLLILTVTWGLAASSDLSSLLLRNARHRLDIQVGKSVSRFLSAVFRVVVISVGAVVLISELGYNINGLIAGLGLGGLTVALAAKDSAANFFGGLTLVVEKPFEIGDWITADNGVEGTVEDIDLRSTKVRTAAGALTIVPNADLSNGAITNWTGSMERRQANFKLSLLYGTPRNKIVRFTDDVRSLLEADAEVSADGIVVQFSDFAESSLDVQVMYYTTMSALGNHLQVRQRINLAILELAEQQGIGFAFPTTTVELEQ